MRPYRSAFTLLEIILVLGIIVIVSALAIPTMQSLFTTTRLTAATDTVRSQWSRARARAIEERRDYRFAVKDNTGMFRVAPDSEEFWIDNNVPGDSGQGAAPLVVDGQLPERITFCVADAGMVPEGSGGEGGAWRIVAVFQADGSARQDVEIAFGAAGSPPTILRLRAVTGDISTAALRSLVNAQ